MSHWNSSRYTKTLKPRRSSDVTAVNALAKAREDSKGETRTANMEIGKIARTVASGYGTMWRRFQAPDLLTAVKSLTWLRANIHRLSVIGRFLPNQVKLAKLFRRPGWLAINEAMISKDFPNAPRLELMLRRGYSRRDGRLLPGMKGGRLE